MDHKYNTSFIPKKFLTEDVQAGSASKYIKHRNVVGPGYFIAVLLFIASIGASVALFAYTRILEKSSEEKILSIEKQLEEINEEDLVEFYELERKMKSAQIILDNHVAFSEVLHKLEEKTLRDVQYTTLTFQAVDPASPAILSLLGVARTFPDVALQTQEYLQDGQFVSPTLTTLSKTEDELVSFSVNSEINRDLTSYDIATREGRHAKSPVKAAPTPSTQSSNAVPLNGTSTQNR
jgi:hypothetical protein